MQKNMKHKFKWISGSSGRIIGKLKQNTFDDRYKGLGLKSDKKMICSK